MRGELPEGWVEVRVGDVAEARAGFAFPHELQGRSDGEIPFAKVGDISNAVRVGEGIGTANHYVSRAELRVLRAATLPVGSTVFAKIGEGVRLNRRAITTREIAVDNNVMGLVPSRSIDPAFLYRWMQTVDLYPLAGSTTIPSVRKSAIEDMTCPLPPFPEQRRIVAKLDELRARSRKAREALEEVPALLERLKQSVLAAAFRGDLTAEWRAAQPPGSVEPASVLLDRIRAERRARWEPANPKKKYVEPEPVDTDGLPELPEGWCWAALEAVSDLQLGQRRAPEYAGLREYPYVRAANITWRGLDLSDVQTMGFGPVQGLFLRVGDVLLSEASGSPTEVGKAALWKGEIESCCFQATVLRLRPHAQIHPEWLFFFCQGEALLGKYVGNTPGIGILHLTSTRMKRWVVPVAPRHEQEALAAVVRTALARVYALEDRMSELSDALTSLDHSLLAKAFRGELVPQDPNDEPADQLLARIKAEASRTSRRSG